MSLPPCNVSSEMSVYLFISIMGTSTVFVLGLRFHICLKSTTYPHIFLKSTKYPQCYCSLRNNSYLDNTLM